MKLVQDFICKSGSTKFISKLVKREKWRIYYEKKRIQYLPLSEILQYQQEKLRNLLKVAYETPYHTPYHKKLFELPDK